MEKHKKTYYKYCVVPMCPNNINTAPDKLYFVMPKNEKLRKTWCKAMRRDDVSCSSCLYCCEDHFDFEEDTENYIQYKIMSLEHGQKVRLRLKKGVVPHVFQCQKKEKSQPPPERKAAMKRKRKALVEEALTEVKEVILEISEVKEEVISDIDLAEAEVNEEVRSEVDLAEVEIKEEVISEVDIAEAEVTEEVISEVDLAEADRSPASVPHHLDVDLDISNNEIDKGAASVPISNVGCKDIFQLDKAVQVNCKVHYKTSDSSWLHEDESDSDLQLKNLMHIGTLIAMEMEPKMLLGLPKRTYYLIKLLSENIPLPIINILITLRKIKLNESFSLLALNFGYSQSSVSTIFANSIIPISEKMKELIFWPTPSQIYENLPISFRARYDNVVSIIDCLEIEIEKPTNAVHQSLTWSQYKKCNTLKYLISCTPDGLVNYVSEGYSGRATDVTIVEDCGFLDCLPPHKAVMADQGFEDLARLLENKNCTLVRPPSVSQSTPNSKVEVKRSKQIAALRIHVERVVARLREFNMLLPHSCIDHHLIPVVDEVIIIACGIINLQDSV